jgi:protein-S-isoprenylcysteine O-methyltransferase Ste14
MVELLRIVLPLYLLAFFLVAFVWRSFLVWKRTGVNPYVVGQKDNAINFIEGVYRVPLVLLAVVTVAFAFFPAVYQYATPLVWLEHAGAQIAGLALLGAALVWTAVAQAQMGASWRIGIDEERQTELVKRGLFKVSRNPIFFGMRLALWGFFLTLPNAFTLLATVLGDVLMQAQVRLEEEFLRRSHGEKYEEYCREVRRWI